MNVHYAYEDNSLTPVAEMAPGNIITRDAENITFANCSFTHLGTTSLDLQDGTNQTSVIGNQFIDSSGIAIQIGDVAYPMLAPTDPEVVANINVIDNYITNCSWNIAAVPGSLRGMFVM